MTEAFKFMVEMLNRHEITSELLDPHATHEHDCAVS